MTEFRVGEAAPPPFNLRNNAEGATLEQAADGTPILIVALPSMTPGESAKLRLAPIHARYISEGGYWLGLVRFGEDERAPLYELEHDPSLYLPAERGKRREAWGRPIPWQILGVDSRTGILRCARIVSPPDRFRESLHLSMGDPRGRDYARRYADWLARLRGHSLDDLWGRATPAGAFGGGGGGDEGEEDTPPDGPPPTPAHPSHRTPAPGPTETLAETLAASFPHVSGATRGKAWTIVAQDRLSRAGLVLPPAPREDWRRRALGIEGERRSAWGVPLLQEIAAILATEAGLEHIRPLVRDVERKYGASRLLYALSEATEALRVEALRVESYELGLDGRSPHYMDFAASCVAVASAITVAHLVLGEISGGGSLPMLWGQRILSASGTPVISDCPSDLSALHTVGLSDWLLRSGYRSARGEIDVDRIESPASLLVGDAVIIPQWSHAMCLHALAFHAGSGGANDDGGYDRASDARRDAAMSIQGSFRAMERLTGAALAGLPKATMPSWASRRECLDHAAYTMWPGVTIVDWDEEPLHGLILATGAPRGSMWANVILSADLSGAKGVRAQLLMDIPALSSDGDWAIAQEDADDEGADGLDALALPMEAVRMCMVSRDRKISGRRVPTGYVHAPRSVGRNDVPVTYIPRVRTVRGEAKHGAEGRYPGINQGEPRHVHAHQVAGHLRQIPRAWSPSDAAREAAREAGLSLPEGGYTYVRPHTRGEGAIEPRHVRVRKHKSKNEEEQS